MINKLNILWTNDNLLTIEHMLFMYSYNTKKRGLWDEINIIVWGATAKLVAENVKIQELVNEAQSVGVTFQACRACAQKFDAIEILESMNMEVIFMADPLTDIIKMNQHLITI